MLCFTLPAAATSTGADDVVGGVVDYPCACGTAEACFDDGSSEKGNAPPRFHSNSDCRRSRSMRFLAGKMGKTWRDGDDGFTLR